MMSLRNPGGDGPHLTAARSLLWLSNITRSVQSQYVAYRHTPSAPTVPRSVRCSEKTQPSADTPANQQVRYNDDIESSMEPRVCKKRACESTMTCIRAHSQMQGNSPSCMLLPHLVNHALQLLARCADANNATFINLANLPSLPDADGADTLVMTLTHDGNHGYESIYSCGLSPKHCNMHISNAFTPRVGCSVSPQRNPSGKMPVGSRARRTCERASWIVEVTISSASRVRTGRVTTCPNTVPAAGASSQPQRGHRVGQAHIRPAPVALLA